MGTEYQKFNWKEYVSLRRFWNMEWKYKTEKAKNEELEEGNKNLRDYADNLDSENDNQAIEIEELKKENKKLKERVSELEDVSKDYDILSKDFITATWEIEFRKDEVERFKTNAVQDMAEITELEIQNKKLKSDLEECKCSFWFENDEVWFWKREYKRLKKWIKDHCKWYWNLFPEDEMKRQWKKADRKRK